MYMYLCFFDMIYVIWIIKGNIYMIKRYINVKIYLFDKLESLNM